VQIMEEFKANIHILCFNERSLKYVTLWELFIYFTSLNSWHWRKYWWLKRRRPDFFCACLSYYHLNSVSDNNPISLRLKVKLSLCFFLTERHAMKAYWGVALDRGERSASRSGRFIPRERASGTHWIGGWVGPRAVLDAVVERKIPSLRRKWNPRTMIVQSVA
jgi:hypothetical protein